MLLFMTINIYKLPMLSKIYGYDLLLRKKQYSLVNFSVTKTLDHKQIKALFSGFNK